MGIKRWLALVFLGELALALAGALVLRQAYRDVAATGPLQALLSLVTLQFLPNLVRALVLVVAGGLLVRIRPPRPRTADDPPAPVPLPEGAGRTGTRRPRFRQPAHRRDERHRRGLRGGGPPGEPRPRRARTGHPGERASAQA